MQQSISHQMMGYDRASTMFSPDGRLLQVEYAKKTVKQGTSVLGIVCKDGVVLVADKRILDKLIVSSSVEKVFQIDEHFEAAVSGIVSDGRILIEKAQIIAQQHRVTYDEPIDLVTLVKEVCNQKQAYTQYGGARPFGTALLIAGVNDHPRLFETDPSGAFTEYHATAIGQGKADVEKLFEERYKAGLSRNDAIDLALIGLSEVSEGKLKKENIDIVAIEKEHQYQRVEEKEIADALGRVHDEINKRGSEKKEE